MLASGKVGGDEGLEKDSEDRAEGLGSAGRGLTIWTHTFLRNGILDQSGMDRLLRDGLLWTIQYR